MSKKLPKTQSKPEEVLFVELSKLIEKSQTQLVSAVNYSLTMLFWHVGKRISEHTLRSKRADYGANIVVTLSRQLVAKYGKNFEEKNLRRMMQFSELFAVGNK
jgi:DUF1016 N-terminal domain